MKKLAYRTICLILLLALLSTPLSCAFAEGDQAADTKQPGHYRFQPKVCSVYMEEVFGKTMVQAWFDLVDAVMAGKDTFPCPDAHTYDWVMGQFRDKCFPPLTELIDYAYNRDRPVKNGVGSFVYTVPREEAARRIADFASLVEGILNEALQDDYSDFEKALALYEYFAAHYTYDYEALAVIDSCPLWLSSYRVLTGGTGICQEVSVAYAYLLMQAGVEATTMFGQRAYDHERHQWAYVRINGRDYHIDPTYVLNDPTLRYFMMDDAQREAADEYMREYYTITSNYSQDHPHPEYAAFDRTYSPLWDGQLVKLDHASKTLYYKVYVGGEPKTRAFHYGELEAAAKP